MVLNESKDILQAKQSLHEEIMVNYSIHVFQIFNKVVDNVPSEAVVVEIKLMLIEKAPGLQ
jgi:hypothetical protein